MRNNFLIINVQSRVCDQLKIETNYKHITEKNLLYCKIVKGPKTFIAFTHLF
jgi:hypothetical protein